MIGNDGDERLDISGDYGYQRDDISVDDGRRVFRSQETSHCSS